MGKVNGRVLVKEIFLENFYKKKKVLNIFDNFLYFS